jgi:hypothetical protein
MKQLEPAPESLFWHWISERHRIYLLRQSGAAKPWTADPILQRYKFTNAFRQLDRGTQWLTQNFLGPFENASGGLIVGNVAWYRMFNWTGTGERLGWQVDWNTDKIKHTLTRAYYDGEQVFTNAHIIWSEEGIPKIDAIVNYVANVWKDKDDIAYRAQIENTLEGTFNRLTRYKGIGGFIAYEIVSDLRHTRLLNGARDIMTWANMGPGAKRGLQRLDMPCKNQKQGVESMQILLSRSQERPNALPVGFPELEMRDIEHSLCEFDKYCRVKFGEGEPRMKFNGV